jgi:hypothetical protein
MKRELTPRIHRNAVFDEHVYLFFQRASTSGLHNATLIPPLSKAKLMIVLIFGNEKRSYGKNTNQHIHIRKKKDRNHLHILNWTKYAECVERVVFANN